MEEKIEILNEHKGEMIYVEYMNAKIPTSKVAIVSNEFRNSYVKMWYLNEGKIDSIFIPIYGINLIANYNYLWSEKEEDIYYGTREKEKTKTLK